MKVLKKSFLVLCMLLVATSLSLFGCADNTPKDVETIEVTNKETTLKPGDYVITARCLPKNSPQGFTAKLNGLPRAVSLAEKDGKYVLTVGANAINGAKISVTVNSSDDPAIKGKKEFTLSIPEPEFIKISDEAGLKAIANNMSGNYKLTCDIILKDKWVQLGDAEHQPDDAPVVPSVNPFKGILDGNGYSIMNINMTDDSTKSGYDRGFFGRIDGSGTVRNIGFDGGKMEFHGWSGVIAAQNFGVISNVFTNIEFYVKGGCAGAFVVTNGGTIENCFAIGKTVSESEDANAAGFIGVTDGGVQTGCFADKETTGLVYFAGGRWNNDNADWNMKYIQKTEKMQTAQTFIDAGWSETYWNLVDGQYPTLKHLA